MKNIWYIILFAIGVFLLINSWPTVDEYFETMDPNWYVLPQPSNNAQLDAEDENTQDPDMLSGDSDVDTGSAETGSLVEENDDQDFASGEVVVEETTTLNGYVEFTPEAFQQAQNEGQEISMFFHADRCPPCNVLDQDIMASQDDIPGDKTIFKVNYDTADELKREHTVTKQHTIIYFDQEGEEYERDTTALTLEELLELY